MKLHHAIIFPLMLSVSGTSVAAGGGGEPGWRDRLPEVLQMLAERRTAHDGEHATVVINEQSGEFAFDEAWVTIYSVTAVATDGEPHPLFTSDSGTVINLLDGGAGKLLDTGDIPDGDYTFEAHLANSVSLVDPEGVELTTQFNGDGTDPVFSTDTPLSIDGTSVLHVAFNLDYDTETGMVGAALEVADKSAESDDAYAEFEGVVMDITSENGFILRTEARRTVTVALVEGGKVVDKHTGESDSTTGALEPGMKVEAEGDFDPETDTLSALKVKFESGFDDGIDSFKAEGSVESYDGSNSLQLDVSDANFMPGADIITVDNVANAYFTEGSLDLLAAGQTIEVEGEWNGTSLIAAIIEIEGAGDDSETGDMYAEIKGEVTAMGENSLTVLVSYAEHTDGSVGGEIVFDTAEAWYKSGDSGCLTVGDSVEIKGSVDGVAGTGVAHVIEVEEGCDLSDDEADDDSEKDDDGGRPHDESDDDHDNGIGNDDREESDDDHDNGIGNDWKQKDDEKDDEEEEEEEEQEGDDS